MEVTAGRVPPQNIEAEVSLLGSLLIEKDAIIKIADMVTVDDFYVDRHSIIFAAMTDLYESRQPIDVVSLSGKLRDASELERVGGATYITELTSAVPTAAHVVHYAGIVSHKATLRRLIEAASAISGFGFDEQTALDQLLDKAERTIFEVSQKNLKQNFIPISSILSDSFERLGELHADSGKLRDFPRINEAMAQLSEAPLYIDDSAMTNVMEMRTKARRLQSEHGLGLIIIDYLQLIAGGAKSNDGRQNEVSEISRGLKSLAREIGVPVIALSQLSRAVESRTPPIPQLSDLRDSGSIEQDADVVMFLYRPWYYNKEEDEHVTELLIKKHRNGPTGDIELYFQADQRRFTDLERYRA
jgi:replicative DNA helicase